MSHKVKVLSGENPSGENPSKVSCGENPSPYFGACGENPSTLLKTLILEIWNIHSFTHRKSYISQKNFIKSYTHLKSH